ncbi:MAG TPA: hypothetical protein VKG63_03195 [Steroidobacteraceae bacterium]|nr:hypothetical protein [Steroidobacteraceae bacterium]
MRNRILFLGAAALALTASSAAFADVHISIDPFGYWGPPPPVVYEPPRYYAPPVVYYGRNHWGDRDSRGHYNNRGRSEHHEGGDRH